MSLVDLRVFGATPVGLRRERIEASPRYRGGRFHNTDPTTPALRGEPVRKQIALFGELFFGASKRTPGGVVPVESPHEAWTRRPETGLRATWLGHSTVLLEIDGFRILTDPVWGERIGPFSFAGPKRFHAAPTAIEALPSLDAILVSHDHYDHLDYPTIRALARSGAPFYTSLGVGAHLEAWGVAPSRIVELDWWEEAILVSRGGAALSFTATPSRHFSGRASGSGTNGTLWSSWVMRTDRHRVFFSGDTGLTRELEEIGRRLGPFDLVMLEVGAHHPAWGEIHLGPANALEAHAMLGGGTLLPVHWGTFDLALHPWEEPAEHLAVAAAKRNIHVVTPRLGRAIEPSRVERIDPWWREVARSRSKAEATSPSPPLDELENA